MITVKAELTCDHCGAKVDGHIVVKKTGMALDELSFLSMFGSQIDDAELVPHGPTGWSLGRGGMSCPAPECRPALEAKLAAEHEAARQESIAKEEKRKADEAKMKELCANCHHERRSHKRTKNVPCDAGFAGVGHCSTCTGFTETK